MFTFPQWALEIRLFWHWLEWGVGCGGFCTLLAFVLFSSWSWGRQRKGEQGRQHWTELRGRGSQETCDWDGFQKGQRRWAGWTQWLLHTATHPGTWNQPPLALFVSKSGSPFVGNSIRLIYIFIWLGNGVQSIAFQFLSWEGEKEADSGLRACSSRTEFESQTSLLCLPTSSVDLFPPRPLLLPLTWLHLTVFYPLSSSPSHNSCL